MRMISKGKTLTMRVKKKVVRLNERLLLGLTLNTEGDVVDFTKADRHELDTRGGSN